MSTSVDVVAVMNRAIARVDHRIKVDMKRYGEHCLSFHRSELVSARDAYIALVEENAANARKADAMEIIALATAGGLERAGFEHVDNPGEAIDILAAERDTLRNTTATAELALRIADHACRSDIEVYARQVKVGVRRGWDLDQPAEAGDDTRIANRAASYIDARGDVFPWRMFRDPDAPHLVFFVDKAEVKS